MRMDKSPDAFRTISEVADLLDTPAHVLRFWESRFAQVRPVKRAGGRRYYRPTDVALLAGIRVLLHDQGLTIRGVQKILRERGVRLVVQVGTAALSGAVVPLVIVEDEEPAPPPAADAGPQAPVAAPAMDPAPQRDRGSEGAKVIHDLFARIDPLAARARLIADPPLQAPEDADAGGEPALPRLPEQAAGIGIAASVGDSSRAPGSAMPPDGAPPPDEAMATGAGPVPPPEPVAADGAGKAGGPPDAPAPPPPGPHGPVHAEPPAGASPDRPAALPDAGSTPPGATRPQAPGEPADPPPYAVRLRRIPAALLAGQAAALAPLAARLAALRGRLAEAARSRVQGQ
ncbi:MAG: MerR family transcriptional regulator [Gemmobacter sp.]